MIDDYTGDFRDGVSSVAMNCFADRRVSASMAYLTEQVRRRPNLTILANAKVERLDVHSGGVHGVQVRTAEGPCTFSATEVILECGAVHSPTLLLRSGIGPADQLRQLGIEVVRDLPGVGRNLQNHPAVTLVMHLSPAGMQSAKQRAWQQNQVRYSSKVAGCADHDMLFLPSNKVGWHPLGQCIAALTVLVQKAYSKGCVELVSADRTVAPRVSFNLLEDSRDFERLVEGLRMALQVLGEKEIMRVRNEVFVPNGAIATRLGKPSAWNWLQAWLISIALGVGPLRRAVLRKSTLDVRSMAEDEAAIRDYVRLHSQAVYHACGTCKMGSASDAEAVVDSSCRVLGVRGLRVVDASVFPSVPRALIHLPVLMTAEKMADRIKAEWVNGRTGRGHAA